MAANGETYADRKNHHTRPAGKGSSEAVTITYRQNTGSGSAGVAEHVGSVARRTVAVNY